jgi:hypothetical protein
MSGFQNRKGKRQDKIDQAYDAAHRQGILEEYNDHRISSASKCFPTNAETRDRLYPWISKLRSRGQEG